MREPAGGGEGEGPGGLHAGEVGTLQVGEGGDRGACCG